MSLPYKILVVDDEVPVCKSISASLESKDYQVDMAFSGFEALQKDENNQYDVVVADLMMPGMSGRRWSRRPLTTSRMIKARSRISTASTRR